MIQAAPPPTTSKVPVRCPPITPFPLQNVASQAPQSLPAISQPPQSGSMGYMGSPAVSMGYQPYSMQVRPRAHPHGAVPG